MTRRLHNQTGICLTEVMVAMAAGAVILSATFQAFTFFEAKLSSQQQTIGRHQDQRLGLQVLEEELRLAGTGAPHDAPALSIAGSREIEFSANLDGLATILTDPTSAIQSELRVLNGTNWGQGKRIVICSSERCVEARLASDGRQTSLSLTAPIGYAFPAGSEVFISNRLRYYIVSASGGKQNLMRQVDGGANPIMGDIARFQLLYCDKQGKPTSDLNAITRIRIDLAGANDRQGVISEIGLRGR